MLEFFTKKASHDIASVDCSYKLILPIWFYIHMFDTVWALNSCQLRMLNVLVLEKRQWKKIYIYSRTKFHPHDYMKYIQSCINNHLQMKVVQDTWFPKFLKARYFLWSEVALEFNLPTWYVWMKMVL